jgi:hypothetical protein
VLGPQLAGGVAHGAQVVEGWLSMAAIAVVTWSPIPCTFEKVMRTPTVCRKVR